MKSLKNSPLGPCARVSLLSGAKIVALLPRGFEPLVGVADRREDFGLRIMGGDFASSNGRPDNPPLDHRLISRPRCRPNPAGRAPPRSSTPCPRDSYPPPPPPGEHLDHLKSTVRTPKSLQRGLQRLRSRPPKSRADNFLRYRRPLWSRECDDKSSESISSSIPPPSPPPPPLFSPSPLHPPIDSSPVSFLSPRPRLLLHGKSTPPGSSPLRFPRATG